MKTTNFTCGLWSTIISFVKVSSRYEIDSDFTNDKRKTIGKKLLTVKDSHS